MDYSEILIKSAELSRAYREAMLEGLPFDARDAAKKLATLWIDAEQIAYRATQERLDA